MSPDCPIEKIKVMTKANDKNILRQIKLFYILKSTRSSWVNPFWKVNRGNASSLLPLPFLSLSVFSVPLSLSSVFRFLLLPPSVPLSLSAVVLVVIYRAKWVAFRCGVWGAAGRSAIGRDCQRSAPLPGFLAGARWVVGHCVRSVGSRRESGRQNSN